MKKAKLWIVYIILILSVFSSVYICAEEISDVVVSLEIDQPIMKVNGLDTEIDAGRGTSPIIKNGRTLVPIRAVIEAFGGKVGWEESTNTVVLTMKDDCAKLTINSKAAYFNNKKEVLDVAPVIINERTMLPIRFIAESFNLGVAWDEKTKTVFIVRNLFDDDEYNKLMKELPLYSGKAYSSINNNKPYFKDYEIIPAAFEYYSELDELGRCDVCFSSVSAELAPTEKRKSISHIKPTGWINTSYDNVDGRYLYNRCHLIGFQLTGENDNEKNLITGTRYLNVEGMFPFENMIDDYIEETDNHVMYRVTPVFKENNLVADGVLLEAYSVEDNGKGISFCVFCYNIQPEIKIDYRTGKSSAL